MDKDSRNYRFNGGIVFVYLIIYHLYCIICIFKILNISVKY